MRWASGEKGFGQLDKPCIFAIQGSYRGCRGRRTGSNRGRGGGGGARQGCTFTSSWGLGWCGAGWRADRNSHHRTGTWPSSLKASGSLNDDKRAQTEKVYALSVSERSQCALTCTASEYLEGAHEGFINAHHAAGVVKLPAVVWSREKCDQLAFGKELIAILHNLLEDTWHYSPAYSDQCQGTDLQLVSESKSASVRYYPHLI